MMNDEQRSELTGLLGGLCEDRLTIEAARRLEQLVCEDEAARRHYVQYMRMVADLQWVASQRSGRDLLARLSTTGGPVATPRLPVLWEQPPTPPIPNLFSRWGLGGGWIDAAPVLVFGVLMLAVGLLVGWRVNHRQSGVEPAVVQKQHSAEPSRVAPLVQTEVIPPRDPAIARLERTVDCQWDNSTLPTQAGSEWTAGRVRLSRGRALIRFESGAEVLLEGPAVFQLNDPLHGELLGGQLVARVPSEASGFTIQTPTATVRDLGTEFGVVADAHGGTEVHVFAGQVELLSPAINAGEVVLLREGQARRLETSHEHGKANWQILPVNQARFALDVDRPTLPLPVEGELLLADDFRGDTLDPSNWRVVTEGVPSGRATVRMENGKLELVNRGHLVTRHQFVPGAGGDLRIRGRFTLASPLDMLQVLTRSDGRPRHDSYGDTTTGIECFVNMDAGGVIGIYGRGEVRLRETIALLEIEQGETFDFELLDTGQTVTFTVRKVGGDGASATVSTYCDQRTDDNFVVLHNRERTRIDRVTEVDHVMIERITTDPLLRETNHEQVADEGE